MTGGQGAVAAKALVALAAQLPSEAIDALNGEQTAAIANMRRIVGKYGLGLSEFSMLYRLPKCDAAGPLYIVRRNHFGNSNRMRDLMNYNREKMMDTPEQLTQNVSSGPILPLCPLLYDGLSSTVMRWME